MKGRGRPRRNESRRLLVPFVHPHFVDTQIHTSGSKHKLTPQAEQKTNKDIFFFRKAKLDLIKSGTVKDFCWNLNQTSITGGGNKY